MTVYDAAIKNLPLGQDVYGDITNCFQDWRAATCDAIFSAPEPTDENANTEWWIAILGNMAWAATVMFPPAFAVAKVAQVAAEEELVIATKGVVEETVTRAVVAGASAAIRRSRFLVRGGIRRDPQGARVWGQDKGRWQRLHQTFCA